MQPSYLSMHLPKINRIKARDFHTRFGLGSVGLLIWEGASGGGWGARG